MRAGQAYETHTHQGSARTNNRNTVCVCVCVCLSTVGFVLKGLIWHIYTIVFSVILLFPTLLVLSQADVKISLCVDKIKC